MQQHGRQRRACRRRHGGKDRRRNSARRDRPASGAAAGRQAALRPGGERDRKSTRLNSSHMSISYAVFCSKKKSNTTALLYLNGVSVSFDGFRALNNL